MILFAKTKAQSTGRLSTLIFFLLIFLIGSISGAPPDIVLNYPADFDSTANSSMDLNVTVSADAYPLKIVMYGDETSNPADMIFVAENISAPATLPIYWNALLLDAEINSVGLWHFDENSDTFINDASGYGNTGYFVNDPVWTDDGKFGYGVEFDGTDDYITIPDLDNSLDADPTTGVLTMEAWIYPHSSAGGTYRAFLSKRDSAISTAVNYALYLDDNTGGLTMYNGTFVAGAGWYESNVILPTNQWSYVAVSLDAAEGMLRFYLNGNKEDSISGAVFGPLNDAELTIGVSETPTGGRFFDGIIDEVRITTRLLSDSEIAANYGLPRDDYAWKIEAVDALSETTVSSIRSFTVGLVLDPVSDASVAEGDYLPVTVSAANPDQAHIDLMTSTLPDNAQFTDNGDGTGTLDFNPDYDQAGDHGITFYADDGIESVERAMTITVINTNRPPDVSDIPDQSTAEGGAFSVIDLSTYVSDPDVVIDDEISWSHSGGTNLSVDITSNSATVTILDGDWFGQETITFRATDLGDLFDEDDVVFTVTGVNDPPTVDEITDQASIVCHTIAFTVTSGDIDGIVTELNATTSPTGELPSGIVFTDDGDGSGQFEWTPESDQAGVYNLRFTAADDSMATGYDDVTVTVTADVTAPQISLTSPAEGFTTVDPFVQLNADLSDETAMTVFIYGGLAPDNLYQLAIMEDVTDPNISYEWDTPVLRTDPLNTIGLWHFGEGTGYNIADYSPFDNDGNMTGTWPTWTADGRFGYAIDFNGTSNMMMVYDNPSLDIDNTDGTLTLEAWIFPHNDGDDDRPQGIIAKRDWLAGSGPCNYQMSLDESNYLMFYCSHSTGSDMSEAHTYTSSVQVPDYEWSYVAVTLDAAEGTARFYRNGVLGDAIENAVFGPNTDGELTIGSAARQYECFDGIIDEVRLSKRVLTDAEIAANFSHIGGGDHYWKIMARDCAGLETVSETRQFTVADDIGPEITIKSPANGTVAIYPHMALEVEIVDACPVSVYIYGDATPSAADLLYVCEYAKSTCINYDWTAAALEPQPPYTAGLWNFDGTLDDSIVDISYNGNNGHFVDNPQRRNDGRFGYAVDFDGVNDYITIPDDNSLDADSATGTLTLEAWLNPHEIGGGVYRAFLSKRNPVDATEVNYALYLDSDDGALSFYNGTFPSGFYISDVILPLNEWSYVAVTLDAGEGILRFYLNGELKSSIPGASFGAAHDHELTIGVSRTPSGSRYYDGLIDDVRVTRRVLTPEEIAGNYLLSGSTYYWRVCAMDTEGNTCNSEIRYFTTNLFVCGDANADEFVNVGDAVFLINYVFKDGPAPDPLEAGDANCDAFVNVGDAVYLINFTFKGGPAPCADCP